MELTVNHIGCCGAFCGTCKAWSNGTCKGCKLGYADGQRDINRSRCAMKLCCFRDKGLQTCADCAEVDTCEIIQGWFSKSGYKYKKYQQAIEFIRQHGYAPFLDTAADWTGAYGKLPEG